MELLGAKEIEIEGAEDSYTKNILRKESKSKSVSNQTLLGEISEQLNEPLRTGIRKSGPTFFSDKTNLTYYIGYRKSSNHRVSIGRSKVVYDQLSAFLEERGYDVEQDNKGHTIVNDQTPESLAELINVTEASFSAS